MVNSYDLLVLGSGSAEHRAIKAAQLGARVGLVEGAEIGGTCPNRGCLPTKHLVTAAERYYYGQTGAFRGVKPRKARLNFAAVMAEKEAVVHYARVEKERLITAQPNITLLPGKGRLVSPHHVAIDGQPVTADHILLATGSSPITPSIPGLADIAP